MILVIGGTGQLGQDIALELKRRNLSYKSVGSAQLDITKESEVYRYITDLKPTAVILSAAYTAVDRAEDESEKCFAVNELGAENVAKACKAIHGKLLYVSTDYVFSGEGNKPYETNEQTAPKSVYGKSKLAGELKVKTHLEHYFIVRTSWVFGHHGSNFVKTMLKLGSERRELSVVDDQIGSPTYALDLAKLICDMIATDKYGTYHATGEGFCSWAEFAETIMKKAGLSCKINKISSSEYPTKAVRPLNSRLSKKSLDENGFKRLPNWEDGLDKFLEE